MQYAPVNENCLMYSRNVRVSGDNELNSVNRILSGLTHSNNSCFYNASPGGCFPGFNLNGDNCVINPNNKDFGNNIKDLARTTDDFIGMDIPCLRNHITKLKSDLNTLTRTMIPRERSNVQQALIEYNNEVVKCNGFKESNAKVLKDGSNLAANLVNRHEQILQLENARYNELNRQLDNKNKRCIERNFYSLSSDRCMEVTFNPSNNEQPTGFPCQKTINQYWSFNNNMLRNAQNSNSCLQVRNSDRHNGAIVALWSNCTGALNQLWDYTNKDELRPRHANNMCLEINNQNKANIWTCHGGSKQKWNMNVIGNKITPRNGVMIPDQRPHIPVFYQNCGYTGHYFSLDVGDYSLSLLNSISVLQNFIISPNDQISSVKVPKGFTVKLYADDFQQGRVLVLREDNDCLVNNNFNDVVTSISVSR